MYFLTKMLFKKSLIWAFKGQNMSLGKKKGFFRTSHLSANPVLPKNEVLKMKFIVT